MKRNERDYVATCTNCGEETVFHLTEEEWDLWIGRICYGKRTLIQDTFPNRTQAERELLRGGMCGKCWKEMFGSVDDEENEVE